MGRRNGRAVLDRPCGRQHDGHLVDVEGHQLRLRHGAVDHRLGGPDVLHGDLPLGVLLGDVGGPVQELYRQPGVAVVGGVLGDQVQGVLGYPAGMEGLLRPGCHYLPQLRLGVSVELDGVGPPERGHGRLVQEPVYRVLGDQDDRHRGRPGDVGPRKLVDHVHRPPLEQHVHLVQDHQEPPGAGRQVGHHRPGHLVRGETPVRVAAVVEADDAQQHPCLGRVAAVDVHRVHGPPGLGHVLCQVGPEPGGGDRLPSPDAPCEERGARPAPLGQRPEQGLQAGHLRLPVDQVTRHIVEVQLGPVADDC